MRSRAGRRRGNFRRNRRRCDSRLRRWRRRDRSRWRRDGGWLRDWRWGNRCNGWCRRRRRRGRFRLLALQFKLLIVQIGDQAFQKFERVRDLHLGGGFDAEVFVLLILLGVFAEDIAQRILDLKLQLGPFRILVGIAFPLQLVHRLDQGAQLFEATGDFVRVGEDFFFERLRVGGLASCHRCPSAWRWRSSTIPAEVSLKRSGYCSATCG